MASSTCTEFLSFAERVFITQGLLDHDIRLDGRKSTDRRSCSIETGFVSQSFGSARVILKDSMQPTDVVVAIKGDLKPQTIHPLLFKNPSDYLVVTVECGGVSTSSSRSSFIAERNARLSAWLTQVIQTAIPPRSLQLEETGNYSWYLRCEVLIVCELGGGLLDSIGLALSAALKSCRLPTVVVEKGSEMEEALTLDDANLKALAVASMPVFLEIGLLNSPTAFRLVADLGVAERHSCSSCFMVAIEPQSRRIYSIETLFCNQLLLPSRLVDVLSLAFTQAILLQQMH